jgi:hypothetical protein
MDSSVGTATDIGMLYGDHRDCSAVPIKAQTVRSKLHGTRSKFMALSSLHVSALVVHFECPTAVWLRMKSFEELHCIRDYACKGNA